MRVLGESLHFTNVGFARGHDALMTLGADTVHFWRPSRDEKEPFAVVRHSPYDQLRIGNRFSPDDRLAVFGSTVYDLGAVWEAFDRPGLTRIRLDQLAIVLSPPPGSYHRLTASGRRFFVGGYYAVVVWDLDRRQDRHVHVSRLHYLTPDPEGTMIAWATYPSREAILTDVETGEERARLAHPHVLSEMLFSHNGKWLATMTGHPSKVRVWEVNSGRCLASFKAFRSWGSALAFSRSDRFLAAGSGQGDVRVYDLISSRETPFRWDVGRVRALSFSCDGLTLAGCGQKAGAVIWDLDDLLPG